MKNILVALSFVFALTACASEQPRPAPINTDYGSLGKIYLNTQDLRVINRTYGGAQRSYGVDQDIQPKLLEAVNRWSADRLQAVGNAGHATLIVKEASITAQGLPVASGIEGWFKRQQDRKYTAKVELQLEAQTPVNDYRAFATAYAVHAATLPERPTEAEKAAVYKLLIESLMAEINRKMEAAIREHMSQFVVENPKAAVGAGANSMTQEQPVLIQDVNGNANPSLDAGRLQ